MSETTCHAYIAELARPERMTTYDADGTALGATDRFRAACGEVVTMRNSNANRTDLRCFGLRRLAATWPVNSCHVTCPECRRTVRGLLADRADTPEVAALRERIEREIAARRAAGEAAGMVPCGECGQPKRVDDGARFCQRGPCKTSRERKAQARYRVRKRAARLKAELRVDAESTVCPYCGKARMSYQVVTCGARPCRLKRTIAVRRAREAARGRNV
jgi:hypothetical protein